jgi:hypothetical protein
MTIGVAVLCGNGQSIVTVSDRRGMLGGQLALVERSKTCELVQGRIVAISADMHPEGDLMRQKFHRIEQTERDWSVREVVNDIWSEFELIREAKQIAYLKQHLGTDLAGFREMVRTSTGTDTRRVEFEMKMEVESIRLEVVVAGVDSFGAHLFYLSQTSGVSLVSDRGFATVGLGSLYALPYLCQLPYSISVSLSKGIYQAYAAKRASQAHFSVGPETDLTVIRPGQGITMVPAEHPLIAKLAEIHEQLKPPPLNWEQEEIISLDLVPVARTGSTPNST